MYSALGASHEGYLDTFWFGELALLSKLWEQLGPLGLQQVSGITCPLVVEKPLPLLMLPGSSVSLTWGLAVGILSQC